MYWEQRALANQNKAERLADTYTQRSNTYYNNAHKVIELRIEQLLGDIEAGYVPTRTELWNMVKWVNLKREIEQQTQTIGRLQIDDIDAAANRVYEETVGLTLREFRGDGKYNLASSTQTRQILNAAFENVPYSQKVWGGGAVGSRITKNSQVLNQRLQKDLTDMICLGKSPNKIKEMIAQDFHTAYHNADRLIRTEANHIYNAAAKDSYRAAGVKRVMFYPESDCCNECEAYKGEYDIDELPLLPIHPNCRCCYVPVVSLDGEQLQMTFD